jgi:hypothetical protein
MAIIGVNRVHCKASDCNKLPFYGHGIMTCRFTPSGRNHLLRPAFTVAPVPSFAHSLVRDLGPNVATELGAPFSCRPAFENVCLQIQFWL